MTNFYTDSPIIGLNDEGIPCSEDSKFYTKSRLNFNYGDGNLTWFHDEKYHFLSTLPLDARLNYKNDAVVAVDASKVIMWHKNGKKTVSEESYTFSISASTGLRYFHKIGGFVDSGKILLDGGVLGHCILLTPLNK
jgi:hypothetical protein